MRDIVVDGNALTRMDIDREVAIQLAIVDTLLHQICEVAAQASPSFGSGGPPSSGSSGPRRPLAAVPVAR